MQLVFWPHFLFRTDCALSFLRGHFRLTTFTRHPIVRLAADLSYGGDSGSIRVVVLLI